MPRDVLVRGIDDKTLAYLEEYRSRGLSGHSYYYTKVSWSELIGKILREWVAEQRKKDAGVLAAGGRLTRSE